VTTLRIVLVIVGVALAVLVGAIIWVVADDGGNRRLAAIGSYGTTGGKTLLLSEGRQLGILKSAECGVPYAELSREPEGRAGPDPKQITGGAQWEPCVLRFGLSMNKELYDWINAALGGRAEPKLLTLQTLDSNYKDRGRLELSQAVLTGFSMPTIDAADNKDAASMTMTVKAQAMKVGAGSGASVSVGTTTQKTWLPANFRFELAGQPVSAVSKLAGLAFKVDPETQRPLIDNFTVTVGESGLGPLPKFLDTFLLGGQNGPEYEAKARLTMLDGTLTSTIGTLDLTGVGIVGGNVGPTITEGDTIARRSYTLYAEGGVLTIPTA
jgi:T4-like virus tail tube protein gp19